MTQPTRPQIQTYLAQVDKPRLARTGRLLLIAKQRSPTFWTTVLPQEVVGLSPENNHLAEGLLVFADVDDKKRVTRITSAIRELPQLLQELSLRLVKYNNIELRIKEWKESLEFQAAQLSAREKEYGAREELLKIREDKLDKLTEIVRERSELLGIDIDAPK